MTTRQTLLTDDEEWLRSGRSDNDADEEDEDEDEDEDWGDEEWGEARYENMKQEVRVASKLKTEVRAAGGVTMVDLIEMAIATLRTEGLRDVGIDQLHVILQNGAAEAAQTVRRRELTTGKRLTDEAMNKLFLE